MINRWNDAGARDYISRYDDGHRNKYDNDLLTQAYATTLLGAENDLTMHGGGNTSVKKIIIDNNGDERRALYVKATGTPLNAFTPEYFVAMDLDFLDEVMRRESIDDGTMAREFKTRQLNPSDRLPSIESLMHASVPAKFVDHTHPAAILKIVNRVNGRELLKQCFGDELAVVPYAKMGYDLAKAVSEAARRAHGCIGVVMAHHGLVVWGDDARKAYETTINIITKAENFLAGMIVRPIAPPIQKISVDESTRNYERIVPIIKGCLSSALKGIGGGDSPVSVNETSLTLLNTPDVLELINSPDGRDIITNPPMTPDYPMYTRILPLWVGVGAGAYDGVGADTGVVDDVRTDGAPEKLSSSLGKYIDNHVINYKNHLESQGVTNIPPADLIPRAIVHPQIGTVCLGADTAAARRTADFARQAFSIRRAIFETGGDYESLPEEYLLDMQYRGYQQNSAFRIPH